MPALLSPYPVYLKNQTQNLYKNIKISFTLFNDYTTESKFVKSWGFSHSKKVDLHAMSFR
jgi:hypothetical protein